MCQCPGLLVPLTHEIHVFLQINLSFRLALLVFLSGKFRDLNERVKALRD